MCWDRVSLKENLVSCSTKHLSPWFSFQAFCVCPWANCAFISNGQHLWRCFKDCAPSSLRARGSEFISCLTLSQRKSLIKNCRRQVYESPTPFLRGVNDNLHTILRLRNSSTFVSLTMNSLVLSPHPLLTTVKCSWSVTFVLRIWDGILGLCGIKRDLGIYKSWSAPIYSSFSWNHFGS